MKNEARNTAPKWVNNLMTGCGCGILLISAFAIFFSPNLHPNHEKARQISCASNEKQLGLALIQYAQDNDENMPDIAASPGSRNTWRTAISPYVKSNGIYHCPSRDDTHLTSDGFAHSYAANYNGSPIGARPSSGNGAFGGAGAKPVNISDFYIAADLIMLCESEGNTPEFNIDDAVHFGPEGHLLWAGHLGKSNYLMADGHAKFYKPLDTKDLWHRDAHVPLTPAALTILSDAQRRAGK